MQYLLTVNYISSGPVRYSMQTTTFNGLMTPEIAAQVQAAEEMTAALEVLDSQIGNAYDEFVRGGICMPATDFARVAMKFHAEQKIGMDREMFLNFATHRMNLILLGMA